MRIVIACTLLCLGLGLSAADSPHPAKIYMEGRTQSIEGFVIHDQVDRLVYSQDVRAEQRGELRQAQVLKIEYGPVTVREWFTAQSRMASGSAAGAAEAAKLYAQVVDKARSEYDQVQGYLGQISAHGLAGEAAKAAAAADAFAQALPRSRFLLQALASKGEILLAAKDLAAAEAAFADLAARDLGPMTAEAKAIASAGRAKVLIAKGDAAGAASAVRSALQAMKREDQPNAYAALGIVGVRALLAAEDAAGALALAQQLLFLGSDPAPQAEAHLVVARAKTESEPVAAFDHAVIATLRGRGEAPDIAAEAASLARTLGKQLSEDESLSDAERLAYKEYAREL